MPFPRGPIVTLGVVAYTLLSLSMPAGVILKPVLGEAADVITMFGFVWPYPLFLSLQDVLPSEGPIGILASLTFILLGFTIVWLFTSYFQRRLGYDKWSNPRAYLWAPWLWFLPLLVLQLAVFGLALSAGLSVGE